MVDNFVRLTYLLTCLLNDLLRYGRLLPKTVDNFVRLCEGGDKVSGAPRSLAPFSSPHLITSHHTSSHLTTHTTPHHTSPHLTSPHLTSHLRPRLEGGRALLCGQQAAARHERFHGPGWLDRRRLRPERIRR